MSRRRSTIRRDLPSLIVDTTEPVEAAHGPCWSGEWRNYLIALMLSKRSTMTEQTSTPGLKNNEEAVEVAHQSDRFTVSQCTLK